MYMGINYEFQNYLPALKREVNENIPSRISLALLQDSLIEQQLYLLLFVKNSFATTIHIHKREGSGLPISADDRYNYTMRFPMLPNGRYIFEDNSCTASLCCKETHTASASGKISIKLYNSRK